MNNPITPAILQSAARVGLILLVGWLLGAGKANTFVDSPEGQNIVNGLVLVFGAGASLGWSYFNQKKLLNTEPPK